eukprot:2303738-Rhodomonas_salina.2
MVMVLMMTMMMTISAMMMRKRQGKLRARKARAEAETGFGRGGPARKLCGPGPGPRNFKLERRASRSDAEPERLALRPSVQRRSSSSQRSVGDSNLSSGTRRSALWGIQVWPRWTVIHACAGVVRLFGSVLSRASSNLSVDGFGHP